MISIQLPMSKVCMLAFGLHDAVTETGGNCWSGQIPCLFELDCLVSALPHCKPNMLDILKELLTWLPLPACCLPGQGDTLLLLSSIRRSSLSALEHKQMPGAP